MRRTPVALLFVLAGILVGASPASAGPNLHRNSESPAWVRAYWTKERMENARPMDPVANGARKEKKGKPPSGGGGGTRAASVEVSSVTGVLTAHGKVFFSDGGVNYVCSGTALVGDVVWTAGHCVNQGPGQYYTNFLFVPAYRDGVAPLGQFPAPTLITTDGWLVSGAFGVDVGAAIPDVNAQGQTLGQAVTERSIVFNTPRQQSYATYGYPAASPFNGQRLRVCNTAWSRDDVSPTPDDMGIACDMNGGSSGGGWVTSTGEVASVVSYGYSNIKDMLFGPHLETEAETLYTTALAAK
jgi:V8-like Glu-specific endopeptidase